MRRALAAAFAWGGVLAAAAPFSSRAQVEYPDSAVVESRVMEERADGVKVVNGGYGSSMAVHPSRAGYFYLLTDRGPNIASSTSEQPFADPSFAPQIGLFRLAGKMLQRVSVLELRDREGRRLTGLPPDSRTGELAINRGGEQLDAGPFGVDSEGLAALADGTFWISDEYGPYLLHVDNTGRTIERIGPSQPGRHERALPRVFAQRQPNRGMEGLTVVPGGRALVGMMQSALDNPTAAVRTSRASRIVALDLETRRTKQYVYLQDMSGVSNSEIAAVSETEFLVLERDDNFDGHPDAPSRQKRVYRIDVSKATDISDPADGPNGRRFRGKTIEEMTGHELVAAGIVPVAKTLLVDLLAMPGGYPHDKPEGLAIIERRMIAVCNDDDFGIAANAQGALIQKTLPGAGNSLDRNTVYFIKLAHPLR